MMKVNIFHTRSNEKIELRPEKLEDESFLRALYGSTREDELSLTSWDDTTKSAFVDMQFKAMRKGYASTFPGGEFLIISVETVPAGRMVVDFTCSPIKLVDMALLPAFRNRGIGARLVQILLDEAASVQKPVLLHVAVNNRAARLYSRLGFRKISAQGFYEQMEWKPPA